MKDMVAAVETISYNIKMKTSVNNLLSKVTLITNSRGQQYPVAASSLPNPKRIKKLRHVVAIAALDSVINASQTV